ncbi:hypothetical protein PEBR_27523 [Penicillium brasilianum]|uniref:tRNA(Ile)-lysidine synthetase n=1 Tax=Penicillium brasilianum TaxID=104259 RepID=A0A1S9RUY6_PENBI|nr:hypothetical protein PEBR_27523 [Penicillium brasilianum]
MAGKKAISVSQFAEHFRRAWLGTQEKFHSGRSLDRNDFSRLPRRLGLAISGGADSMALAFLCRQLERSALAGPISVTAFVVDHRARVESSQEARTVAGWLTAMGIKTKILELDWARFAKQDRLGLEKENSPLPSAFETHARHLRFRALGTACRERGINALLMGHHQDDTVETTIWRLSSGGRGAGLAGIPEVARIPECHGLFGVSESGSTIQLAKHGSHVREPFHVQVDDKNKGSIMFNPTITQKDSSKHQSMRLSSPDITNKSAVPGVSVATGGIHICRPLLSFPKTSLLETCHQNKIPYVSDPTNFDPTLTPRNAIRSMLASDSLPRALRAPSILSLIRSSQAFLHTSTEFSNKLLASKCRILDLNLEAGTMVLQIRDLPSFLDPLKSQLSPSRLFQIQALTLRRITGIISPFHGNHFPVRSYEPFVSRVFTSQEEGHDGNAPESSNSSPASRQNFTLGGVLFQPLTVKDTRGQVPGGNNIWLLSRQPFFKNKGTVSRLDIQIPNGKHSTEFKSPTGYTPWTLWDDRYWFRFKVISAEKNQGNRSSKTRNMTLVIRPLQQPDLSKIRIDPSLLPEMKRSKKRFSAMIHILLKDRLSENAPGSARFTLPALAVEKPGASPQPAIKDAEQLIALPTLDFPLDALSRKKGPNAIEFTYREEKWRVTWEWMYKMVDTEAIRLMGGPGKVEAESASVHDDEV